MLNNFKDYEVAKEKLSSHNFPKGLVAFGSARIPMDDPHIKEIEEISRLCATRVVEKNKDISFITGGGPSIMTAWLEQAHIVGAKTGGMALLLPHEKEEDQLKFCDRDTSCVLETFQARKALMLEYARCIIIFKGGFGTMDELFEALTFIKTHKIPEIPIFIYPADFYKDVLNFRTFIEAKTINPDEDNVLKFMHSKDELIKNLYEIIDNA